MAFLAAVAAVARRLYIARAVLISDQARGMARKVGSDWVVIIGGKQYPICLQPIIGGYQAKCEEQTYTLLTDWRFGSPLFRARCNGEPVVLQLERIGLRFHIVHNGASVDAIVMTARAAHLLSLMRPKPKPDLSQFLLSPMPGLLSQVAVTVGQEVKAGERLAVIEAMKMENVLKAEHDVVVAELLARAGDSVAVDQPILKFR